MRSFTPVLIVVLLAGPLAAQIAAGISLQQVKFAGVSQLPSGAVAKCAADLKARPYEGTQWLEEVAERARVQCWQHAGYFKVRITPSAEQLPDRKGSHWFNVTLAVEEGAQYRLAKIEFTGNKAFTSDQLRAQFPLEDGAIFDSDKFRRGLENVRRAYGARGYINFVSVPDIEIDEHQLVVRINLTVEEGSKS